MSKTQVRSTATAETNIEAIGAIKRPSDATKCVTFIAKVLANFTKALHKPQPTALIKTPEQVTATTEEIIAYFKLILSQSTRAGFVWGSSPVGQTLLVSICSKIANELAPGHGQQSPQLSGEYLWGMSLAFTGGSMFKYLFTLCTVELFKSINVEQINTSSVTTIASSYLSNVKHSMTRYRLEVVDYLQEISAKYTNESGMTGYGPVDNIMHIADHDEALSHSRNTPYGTSWLNFHAILDSMRIENVADSEIDHNKLFTYGDNTRRTNGGFVIVDANVMQRLIERCFVASIATGDCRKIASTSSRRVGEAKKIGESGSTAPTWFFKVDSPCGKIFGLALLYAEAELHAKLRAQPTVDDEAQPVPADDWFTMYSQRFTDKEGVQYFKIQSTNPFRQIEKRLRIVADPSIAKVKPTSIRKKLNFVVTLKKFDDYMDIIHQSELPGANPDSLNSQLKRLTDAGFSMDVDKQKAVAQTYRGNFLLMLLVNLSTYLAEKGVGAKATTKASKRR